MGDRNVLEYAEAPGPIPGPDDVLIQVHATALNRIDLVQRYGVHQLPQSGSPLLGIEAAGNIVELGGRVTDMNIGDRVFGLVNGGGYAQYCVMDHKMAFPMPEDWGYREAAAVPEVFLTASERLFTNGNLQSGQTVIIHAGGSGVGTAAIQLAHYVGARVYITAGSDEKITKCLSLGADLGINYKTHDFVQVVLEKTDQEGVDLVLDCIGPAYLKPNIQILKPDGKLVVMGLLSGTLGEIDLKEVIVKRVAIIGDNLYLRNLESQREITKRFSQIWLPVLEKGRIKPIIDSVFSIEKVENAHQRMRANLNVGKIILEVTH
jgi:putative PIG3 family NAD(P)H quinone oxidoreductase